MIIITHKLTLTIIAETGKIAYYDGKDGEWVATELNIDDINKKYMEKKNPSEYILNFGEVYFCEDLGWNVVQATLKWSTDHL